MITQLQSLTEIAENYDAIVLDQWGVLHDGTRPYPHAVAALTSLAERGTRMAVLSNSGKRAGPNADRIAAIGFPAALFEVVMTSGEALWRDIQAGRISEQAFFAMERQPGDAATWADGLGITLTDIQSADAVLLMGLADDASEDAYRRELDIALQKGLTVYCSNPDLASPRGDGSVVISPGKLAHDHQARGGKVVFYGKPHKPIFQSVETALGTTRLLMIGDSLDHDIKGAAGSAWDSVFVMGGLYAQAFAGKDPVDVLTSLVQSKATPDPTFIIETVQ